jgi:O-antigen/teichoic acid export membrane protein
MPRLGQNILYNVAGQSLVLILSFVAIRLLYRHFGGDAVGIVFFAVTLNAILTSVLDLGLSSTLVREVAGRLATSSEYVWRLSRTAGLFYWSAYFLLTAVVLSIADVLVRRWLVLTELDPSIARTTIAVLAAGSLLALPRSLYASVLRGLQRIGTTNLIDVGTAAAQQAGIAVAIVAGGDLVTVAVCMSVAAAAGVIAYVVAVGQVVPARALKPAFHADVLRSNRGYAMRLSAMSVLAMVHTHADKLMVSRLLPLSAFGLYGFTFSILNRGMLLTGAVTNAAFPVFSSLHGRQSEHALRSQYATLQHLISYAMIVVFAAAPFAAKPVTALVFGTAAAPNPVVGIWTLLSVGFYMNATLSVPHVFSLAVGKPEIALWLNIWALAVVLPLGVLLVWIWGLEGAACSWVLYHVFAYCYVVPRLCRECTGVRPDQWYMDV